MREIPGTQVPFRGDNAIDRRGIALARRAVLETGRDPVEIASTMISLGLQRPAEIFQRVAFEEAIREHANRG